MNMNCMIIQNLDILNKVWSASDMSVLNAADNFVQAGQFCLHSGHRIIICIKLQLNSLIYPSLSLSG